MEPWYPCQNACATLAASQRTNVIPTAFRINAGAAISAYLMTSGASLIAFTVCMFVMPPAAGGGSVARENAAAELLSVRLPLYVYRWDYSQGMHASPHSPPRTVILIDSGIK